MGWTGSPPGAPSNLICSMILSCEPLQAELRPLLRCWYSSYFRAYIRKAVQQTPEHLLTFSNKEIIRACRKLVSDRKKWGTENKMGKKILKYISDPIKKKKKCKKNQLLASYKNPESPLHYHFSADLVQYLFSSPAEQDKCKHSPPKFRNVS